MHCRSPTVHLCLTYRAQRCCFFLLLLHYSLSWPFLSISLPLLLVWMVVAALFQCDRISDFSYFFFSKIKPSLRIYMYFLFRPFPFVWLSSSFSVLVFFFTYRLSIYHCNNNNNKTGSHKILFQTIAQKQCWSVTVPWHLSINLFFYYDQIHFDSNNSIQCILNSLQTNSQQNLMCNTQFKYNNSHFYRYFFFDDDDDVDIDEVDVQEPFLLSSLASEQYKNRTIKKNAPRNCANLLKRKKIMISTIWVRTTSWHICACIPYKKQFMCIITAYLSRFFCKTHILSGAQRERESTVCWSVHPSKKAFKIHHHHIISYHIILYYFSAI